MCPARLSVIMRWEVSMHSAIRVSASVVILLFCAACQESRPTAPTAVTATLSTPAPAPLPTSIFPPLQGPSRTFNFDRPLSYPVQRYTESSRFVLFENGAFILEYPSLGGGYRGSYKEADGLINFTWEGWSRAGDWGASGEITGDTLTVRYNFIMSMSDFDDAIYVK